MVRVDGELLLIVGIAVAILSLPAMISSFSSSRPPRAAMIAALVGGVLIIAAIGAHPGGYRMQDLPQIAARVFDRYLH
jgi:ABC-type Mn2+/Zn2+ transport system permease subunit